jgi:hypothetical protein
VTRRGTNGVVVYLLIAAILPVAGGIAVFPAPIARTGQAADADGEWYPCKGDSCGCTCAESCRQHCCCHRNTRATKDVAEVNLGGFVAGKSGFRIEIRSSSCSGEHGWLTFEAAAWEATIAASPATDCPPVHVAHVIHGRAPDCPGILKDPPPPRADHFA